MKAAFFQKAGAPEDLEYGEVPTPHPQEGEVLVKVYATTIMPTELQWPETWRTYAGTQRPFPVILSHEFSGVVEKLGPRVTDFKVGDEVYGMNDWASNGAQAEYCVAPAGMLAFKPKSVDHAHAAVIPISGLTSWQGLFDRAHLQADQTVLIHGGAGAVGGFAVQLARWRGARIIATATGHDADLVRGLGADQVIDYQTQRFERLVGNLDVVFDTVGGETLERSWGVLKSSGKLVTIATESQTSTDPRVGAAFFIMEPNHTQLDEIAHLIDAGRLCPAMDSVFSLEDARQAYEHAREGHLHGKIALSISGEVAEDRAHQLGHEPAGHFRQ